MRVFTGEVAPLAPLLIPIGEIVVWAVALAFCLLCVYIARAFFGTVSGAVGWIPWFGKVASRSITDIEHKIVSVMSGAAASVDAKMGAAFHELARVIDWLGREIWNHSNLIYTLSRLVLGNTVTALLQQFVAQLRHRVTAVEAYSRHLLHRMELAEKRLWHGIGNDVLPRIRSLERRFGRVIGRDLDVIRAREAGLEHGAIRTWKWIRAHPNALASTVFAGAVAWALARLGAGWVRCGNWRKIGRGVCAAPTGEIDALIALLAAGATVASFRELVKLGQQVERGVTEVLQEVAKL